MIREASRPIGAIKITRPPTDIGHYATYTCTFPVARHSSGSELPWGGAHKARVRAFLSGNLGVGEHLSNTGDGSTA